MMFNRVFRNTVLTAVVLLSSTLALPLASGAAAASTHKAGAVFFIRSYRFESTSLPPAWPPAPALTQARTGQRVRMAMYVQYVGVLRTTMVHVNMKVRRGGRLILIAKGPFMVTPLRAGIHWYYTSFRLRRPGTYSATGMIMANGVMRMQSTSLMVSG